MCRSACFELVSVDTCDNLDTRRRNFDETRAILLLFISPARWVAPLLIVVLILDVRGYIPACQAPQLEHCCCSINRAVAEQRSSLRSSPPGVESAPGAEELFTQQPLCSPGLTVCSAGSALA